MKNKFLITVSILTILVLVVSSCKKDRGPRLIVTVQEADGTLTNGARVHAWYGLDAADTTGRTFNDLIMNQKQVTDASGEAIFDFKYSAVLDVDVVYYKETADSITPTIINVDTLRGHEVVKVERVRQRSKENNYPLTVVVR